jgi:dienelactone hydrolase
VDTKPSLWSSSTRRGVLRAGAATFALAAFSPAARALRCSPETFDPEAWLAERGQGLLATVTPQSGQPLLPIQATDLASWLAERELYAVALRELIGPWPAPPPLAPRVLAKRRTALWTRYQVAYQSLPAKRRRLRTIRAYLFVPNGPPLPRPAIVVPHQTVLQGKDEPAGIEGGWEQAFAKYYAERGYVTLAPDAIGYGDRTIGCNRAFGFELGDAMPILENYPEMTLLGLMLFDLTRGIDFLVGRPEVDPSRIGMIGHSQGGFLTNFLLGLEPRLRVGVASCGYGLFRTDEYFSSRWAYYNSAYLPRMWLYRDDPRQLPIDFLQIMALAAPRAHMIQTAMGDTIWSLPAVAQDSFVAGELRRVRSFYGAAVEDDFVDVQPNGGGLDTNHGWWPNDAQPAADALLGRVLRP